MDEQSGKPSRFDNNPIKRNNFFRRIPLWGWIALVAISLLLIIITITAPKKNNRNRMGQQGNSYNQENFIPEASIPEAKQNEKQWPSVDAKYITAVPLDLTQIQSISKYRSCAGHDSSGYNFEQTKEENRTMKHYIYPVPAFQGTTDKVKMFAPFDGKVAKIDAESDQIGQPGKRPKTGNGISFTTPVDKNAYFEFGHIYFVKDFKVGDNVKAGDLIGYAALGDKGNDFDIVLTGPRETMDTALGSAFDHMTENVLAEFAKYGVTPENTKISKEVRDASPCNYGNQRGDRAGSDWVTLTH